MTIQLIVHYEYAIYQIIVIKYLLEKLYMRLLQILLAFKMLFPPRVFTYKLSLGTSFDHGHLQVNIALTIYIHHTAYIGQTSRIVNCLIIFYCTTCCF